MIENIYPLSEDRWMFFYKRLAREVSNLFVWQGLEELNIPVDRIEHSLITLGRLMFFSDDSFGYLILPTTATGYNIYNDPVMARPSPPNSSGHYRFMEKTIIYEYTPELIDPANGCVLLDNMLYGESLHNVLMFYAKRMAMVWQSHDINLLWQNMPPIISVQDQNTYLSIKKAIDSIWKGEPIVIKDEALKFTDETVQIGLADIPMKLKELFDAYQEIYNDFKAYIGMMSSAVDKQSGVTEVESTSNKQGLRTALEVMLSQRQRFCRLVNKIYGLNLSVDVQGGLDIYKEEEEEDDGFSDDGAAAMFED